MKIKVSEASTRALDWLAAKAEGVSVVMNHPGWAYIPKGKRGYYKWSPATNWKQAGPIIERERINVATHMLSEYTESKVEIYRQDGWTASTTTSAYWITPKRAYGPTPLIAGMRCYVSSKLGDEVEVPDELGGV